jgi:hypothetical protein
MAALLLYATIFNVYAKYETFLYPLNNEMCCYTIPMISTNEEMCVVLQTVISDMTKKFANSSR